MKQSGGNIFVYSEPGAGTTFKIYLPRAMNASPSSAQDTSPDFAEATGSETILLAADEPRLRAVTGEILRSAGYTVLEPASAAEAAEPKRLRYVDRARHPSTCS